MVLGTMLASAQARLLRCYQNRQNPSWRDSTPVQLQLYEQPNAQFRIVAKHLESMTEVVEINLNEVQYHIMSESLHDVRINENLKYSIQFPNPKEGQMLGTIINNTTHEIKRAGTAQAQGGVRKPPPTAPRPSSITGMPGKLDKGLVTLYENLKRAVANGDVVAAKDFAGQLAEKKVQMDDFQNTNMLPPPAVKSELINVKVHIEDKVSTGGVVVLKVRPSSTIAFLKREMAVKYNFPEQVQRWIIGKRLGKDHETLSSFGIKSSGSSLYLYLVSAASVGLTKDQYEAEQLARLHPPPPSPGTPNGVGVFAPGQPVTPPQANQIIENFVDLRSPENEGMAAAGGMVGIQPVTRPKGPAPPPPAQRQPSRETGWTCPQCTFKNPPTRPGCEMCSFDRPDNFKVPDDYIPMGNEKQRLDDMAVHEQLFAQSQQRDLARTKQMREMNFQNMLAIEEQHLIPNIEEFDCPICFLTIEIGRGVILRDCLHTFCRECLGEHIALYEEAEVKCPYQDEVHSCPFLITEREIKASVTPHQFQKYLERGLHMAENQAPDSYHCKTPDCNGWCYYEDDNNNFHCPVCRKINCLTCKAIHEGVNCKEYQDDLRRRSNNDIAAKQTRDMLEQLVANNEAIHCPRCNIILQKKEGCDWLRCTMCKLEICWVTKGPRWGPEGQGDISGGCRCRVNNQKCHPNCRNCH